MSKGHFDLLDGIGAEDAERILALGSRVALSSGEELFPLGADADCLFLISHGQISLTLPMKVRDQETDVLVEERTAGQTVGWSGLIPPHRFTLRATAPVETEVVALSRESLEKYFAAHPEAGYKISLNLAAVIGQRLQLFQAMWLREVARMMEHRAA
ncbi:MAG TPA: cyclic nucleotide-binding domain-containing protein [Bryobacteraceae bacterium]|nr:cyclic nucleotide-binding domain-containing protein [Bryobacteraceae bacterium]